MELFLHKLVTCYKSSRLFSLLQYLKLVNNTNKHKKRPENKSGLNCCMLAGAQGARSDHSKGALFNSSKCLRTLSIQGVDKQKKEALL